MDFIKFIIFDNSWGFIYMVFKECLVFRYNSINCYIIQSHRSRRLKILMNVPPFKTEYIGRQTVNYDLNTKSYTSEYTLCWANFSKS